MRPDPTQRGNPHQLTIRQHVFPKASISRFAGADGKITVKLCGDTGEQRLDPDHSIFCVQRLWDQRSEKGLMKDIEDSFQPLADKVVSGLTRLDLQQNLVATRFFALWLFRTQLKYNPFSDQTVNGVHGEQLTTDQQERLEKQGGAYIRSDQSMPGRFLAGLHTLMAIDAVVARLQGTAWGIIRAGEGEFICPDTFGQLAAIPVTPAASLYLGAGDAMISRQEVARWNRLAQESARSYRLARDFTSCPL